MMKQDSMSKILWENEMRPLFRPFFLAPSFSRPASIVL